MVELIEERIGRLDPAERDVLELLAYAEPIGPDLLARLVSAEAVEAMEAKALCWAERSGRRLLVHLIHPLYGEVLRARTPMLRARRRQHQLAEVLEQTGARRADDPLRVAIWQLAGGTRTSAPVLLAAARRAWALLDSDLTERMAREAYQAGAKLDAAEILWRVLMLQDRIGEAHQLLAGVEEEGPTSDQERARLTTARAYLYWGSEPSDAHLAVIEEALAELADPLARAQLLTLQAAMIAHAYQFQRAAKLANDLLHRPGLPGPVLGYAYFTNALIALFHGQTAKAIAGFDQAIAAHQSEAAETPWFEEVTLLWRCQAQLMHGELTAAAVAAEAGYERGLSSGSNMVIGLACLRRGQVCRARGQLQHSLRWLREGIAVLRADRGFVSQLRGELAHTAAQLGDHATAETALSEAYATRRHSMLVYHLWLDLARPWVTVAGGDRTAAVRQILQVAETMRKIDAPAYEAVALHDATRFGSAGKTVDRLHKLAQHSPSRLIRAFAAHAAGLAACDGAALEQVSLDLETIGALLLAAEASAEASWAHWRAGRGDSARRATARAAALAEQCDGPRTPALQALQAPQLTPREWEIVNLAAAGLTDAEIANRLVVSIRTVHNHLHHAYTKLGVHSRKELASIAKTTAQSRN